MYVNVHAIVLSSVRAAEKDKRLSLFTREQGRLYALALGSGRPGARLAAATEPAVESRFRLWLGEGAPRARVTGGSVACSFPALRGSWPRMSAALFLCEWTDRLTALAQPSPDKYDLLRRALAALETEEEVPVRLAFLIQFLERAGYAVGEDVLGSQHGRWTDVVRELNAYGFDGGFSAALPDPAFLEERLVNFVSPLLARPLKTLAHETALRNYRKTALRGAA